MSRTADWIHSTRPGVPPPPPSRSGSSPAPTIYPSSSVSNPDASRYRRLRSQSLSQPSSRGYQDTHRGSSRANGGGSRMYVPSSGTYVRPDSELPVVAKTMSQDGKTKSWVIIPPEGQRVEVVTPQRPATSMGHHYGGRGNYGYTSASSPTSSTSKSPKNFVKRMLDRVEWGGKTSSSAHSRSHSIPPSQLSSSSSRRSRRNSTDYGSGGFTVLSAGGSRGRDSRASVSTVRAGGRKIDVIRI